MIYKTDEEIYKETMQLLFFAQDRHCDIIVEDFIKTAINNMSLLNNFWATALKIQLRGEIISNLYISSNKTCKDLWEGFLVFLNK